MNPMTDPVQHWSEVAGIVAAGAAVTGMLLSFIRRRARHTVRRASGGLVAQAGRDIGTVVQGETVHVAIAREGQRQGAISAERQRRTALLAQLRHKYVLSHDGLSPGMLAGLEPLPKDWIEAELAALRETWRQDEYRCSVTAIRGGSRETRKECRSGFRS